MIWSSRTWMMTMRRTLDVDQAEKLATLAKQDREVETPRRVQDPGKAKRAADDITKLVNKLYRRELSNSTPTVCGGEEARFTF